MCLRWFSCIRLWSGCGAYSPAFHFPRLSQTWQAVHTSDGDCPKESQPLSGRNVTATQLRETLRACFLGLILRQAVRATMYGRRGHEAPPGASRVSIN